jgi:hypothetical protein
MKFLFYLCVCVKYAGGHAGRNRSGANVYRVAGLRDFIRRFKKLSWRICPLQEYFRLCGRQVHGDGIFALWTRPRWPAFISRTDRNSSVPRLRFFSDNGISFRSFAVLVIDRVCALRDIRPRSTLKFLLAIIQT